MDSYSKNVVTEGVVQLESPLGLEQHEKVSVDNSGLCRKHDLCPHI